MKTILTFCFMASLFCFAARTAKADLIIDVRNATITSGGTGFIDVYITGGPSDTLGRFGYEFNITGATAQSGDLRFAALQSKSEQVFVGPPKYVFLGDTDTSNLTKVRGNGGLNALSLVGGDLLNSLDSVNVNGTFLLARLELEHFGPSLGNNDFTISLNLGSAFTEFDRDFDVGTNNNFNASLLSSTSGIVSIAAVPEPSSLALIVIGGARVIARSRRRK